MIQGIKTKHPPPEERYHVADREAAIKLLKPLSLRERLATLRSIFNLSQEEAGALVGAGRNTWGNWEAPEDSSRKSWPSRLNRAKLGMIFNLPPSLFLGDQEYE